MENVNPNNVNLQRSEAKSKQLTNGQRHDIWQQPLQYINKKRIKIWWYSKKLATKLNLTLNFVLH